MNIYQRLDSKIREASTCDRIRWYSLLDECHASELESLAKNIDKSDSRRTMAREIVYDLFISVFGKTKL